MKVSRKHWNRHARLVHIRSKLYPSCGRFLELELWRAHEPLREIKVIVNEPCEMMKNEIGIGFALDALHFVIRKSNE